MLRTSRCHRAPFAHALGLAVRTARSAVCAQRAKAPFLQGQRLASAAIVSRGRKLERAFSQSIASASARCTKEILTRRARTRSTTSSRTRAIRACSGSVTTGARRRGRATVEKPPKKKAGSVTSSACLGSRVPSRAVSVRPARLGWRIPAARPQSGSYEGEHVRGLFRGVREQEETPQRVLLTRVWIRGRAGCAAWHVTGLWAVPSPLAATVDHVIPVSRGGPHARGNVRCAHFSCNTKRGNTLCDDGKTFWGVGVPGPRGAQIFVCTEPRPSGGS